MTRRLFTALAVDFDQWKALVRVALKSDLRGTSRSGHDGDSARPLIRLFVINLIAGVFFALLAARARDVLFSGTVFLAYAMFLVASLVLMDFHSIVVSPDDVAILGYRPITSRTYFASRVTNVLVYTGAVATALGILPIVSYTLFATGFNPLLGLASAVALYAGTAATSLGIVLFYVAVLRYVHPQRLRRALSYLQLGLSFLVYGAFLAPQLVDWNVIAGVSVAAAPWVLVLPPAWFASYLPIAAGVATAPQMMAATASLVLVGLVVRYGAGRLSLDYSERLAAMSSAGEPAAAPRSGRLGWRLPFFRAREGRAVALLVQAQFRFDARFRLGVLGVVPLTFFYLAMGLKSGSLGDPFATGSEVSHGATQVFFAIAFFPLMLHAILLRSDAFAASWVFFVTPAVRHRLVLAMKQFVTIYFLLPYLLLLASFFAFFYERAWHAFGHLAVLGLIAHAVLQTAILFHPGLPFSQPVRRAQRSANIWFTMIVVGFCSGMMPVLVRLAYPYPARLAAVVVALLAVTILLETLIKKRVALQSARLEFAG
jgi:hypothetical protein